MNGDFVEVTPGPVTERDVREYAEWLGADLPADNDLLWIAREALYERLRDVW